MFFLNFGRGVAAKPPKGGGGPKCLSAAGLSTTLAAQNNKMSQIVDLMRLFFVVFLFFDSLGIARSRPKRLRAERPSKMPKYK